RTLEPEPNTDYLRVIDVPPSLHCCGGSSDCWRETDDDVESGCQFTDARPGHRHEIDKHRFARLRITNAAEHGVTFVPRLPLHVTLSRPSVAPLHFDGEMNMRGAARVRHRFDRSESVFACGSRDEAPEPLEMLIARTTPAAGRVQIDAVVIDLPDLND